MYPSLHLNLQIFFEKCFQCSCRGIFIGTLFLNKGFSLKRAYDVGKAEGVVMPAIFGGLLLLFLLVPTLFKMSETGPGSMQAPVIVAFVIALVVGALAQRGRLCMAGGIRDGIMFRDLKLLYGFVAIFLVALVGNLITNKFNLGFRSQPVAHSAHLWNFLGMLIVGWGSVLLGGCPLRQLILAGSGNGDSAVTVLGMMAGAAIAHNFGLAGSADSVNEAGEYIVGGIKTNGKVAVFIALAVLLVISLVHLPRKAKKEGGAQNA
ncbi:MAG: YedE-related selenium metabolism membrane protein [Oscillospiraceae bacterium]|nr:YedE-related selenium metabolism membrane protein [Oscillospiraceae bacterium]